MLHCWMLGLYGAPVILQRTVQDEPVKSPGEILLLRSSTTEDGAESSSSSVLSSVIRSIGSVSEGILVGNGICLLCDYLENSVRR